MHQTGLRPVVTGQVNSLHNGICFKRSNNSRALQECNCYIPHCDNHPYLWWQHMPISRTKEGLPALQEAQSSTLLAYHPRRFCCYQVTILTSQHFIIKCNFNLSPPTTACSVCVCVCVCVCVTDHQTNCMIPHDGDQRYDTGVLIHNTKNTSAAGATVTPDGRGQRDPGHVKTS